MAIVAIIPARFASTRLPGKPLSDIHGKPMIQLVHERVRRARRLTRVLVATDDQRIASVVRGFGGEVVITSPRHATGTDRLAEAVLATDATIVVNVQGDEPMLDPGAIDAAVAAMDDPSRPEMATVSLPLTDWREMLAPSVVKVVTDARGDALYFSRGPIPAVRLAGDADPAAMAREAVALGLARKHLGLYVFTREALLRFASLAPAPLEQAEGLEQLRALYHGMRIRVVRCADDGGVAVDTPQDLERVRALLGGANNHGKGANCPPSTSS